MYLAALRKQVVLLRRKSVVEGWKKAVVGCMGQIWNRYRRSHMIWTLDGFTLHCSRLPQKTLRKFRESTLLLRLVFLATTFLHCFMAGWNIFPGAASFLGVPLFPPIAACWVWVPCVERPPVFHIHGRQDRASTWRHSKRSLLAQWILTPAKTGMLIPVIMTKKPVYFRNCFVEVYFVINSPVLKYNWFIECVTTTTI